MAEQKASNCASHDFSDGAAGPVKARQITFAAAAPTIGATM